jgi:pilus assembly protein TadC
MMEAAEAATLIRARVPELSARDLDAIAATLSGEMLPINALEVVLALIERLEERFDAMEAGQPHRVL